MLMPFDPTFRPVPFHHDGTPVAWENSLCPCGSGDAASDCHFHRPTEKWRMPRYDPVVAGPVTGYSHHRCFASATNDCSDKISLEHPLSKGILKAVGDGKTVEISDSYWQRGRSQPERMSVKTLGSNMLCDRHNKALSNFDTTAIRAQSTLERYQLAQLRHPDPHGSEFDRISGERFERWLLKMAWGFKVGAKELPVSLRQGRERNALMRYLFRDGLMPKGWGLYVRSLTKTYTRKSDIAVEARVDVRDETFLSTDITLGAVTFTFAAGKLEAENGAYAVHRPDGIRLYSDFDQSCKVLAFSWDHRRHEYANFVDIRFRGSR
jgi:hypothetical protein